MSEEKDVFNTGMMRAIRMIHGIVNDKNDLEKNRAARESFGALLGKAKDIIFTPVVSEGMNLEWVRPEQKHSDKSVLLYCHGGGYITGNMRFSRALTTKFALTLNMDVLCFDYRLAPENQYPCALEDAVKAWNYLMLLGYGSRDVVIAGDSAGGNLALALTLYLKQEKRKLPRGLILMSPWTDLTCSGHSYTTRAEIDPILDAEYIHSARDAYVGEMNPDHPFISPLFGDYSGFPPTYIQVGNNEILLTDSLALFKQLKKCCVNTKLSVYRGMWHVFQMSPFKKASDALNEAADFIFGLN